MQADRVQNLVLQLQDALGISVACGSITLNMNEGRLQSLKTEQHVRVQKAVDKHGHSRQT